MARCGHSTVDPRTEMTQRGGFGDQSGAWNNSFFGWSLWPQVNARCGGGAPTPSNVQDVLDR